MRTLNCTEIIGDFLVFLIVIGSTMLCCPFFTDEVLYPKWFLTIIASCLLLIVYLYSVNNKKALNFKHFEICVILISVFECILMFLQEFEWIAKPKNYVLGSFDSVAGFVSFICLTLPFGLRKMLCKKRVIKVLIILSKILCVSAIVYIESRIGMMCIFVIGFQYIFISLKMPICKQILCNLICIFVVCIPLSTLMKTDSSKGRWFIAMQTLEIVKERPIAGHGKGSFVKDYMAKQASYFVENPTSEYAFLADNIHHPISDALLILYEFGFIGLAFCMFLFFYLLFQLQKKKIERIQTFISLLLVFAICFVLSYPLRYPFTWVVLVYAYISIVPRHILESKMLYKIAGCLSVCCIVLIVEKSFSNIRWHNAQTCFENGNISIAVLRYRQLYEKKKEDYRFLYDYSYVLYSINRKKDALKVALECSHFLSDYNLNLLIGYIYRDIGQFKNAILMFENAHYMCPSRLVPLYEEYITCRLSNNFTRCDELAKIIVDYPIKVHSATTDNIQSEMKLFLSSKHNGELEKCGGL